MNEKKKTVPLSLRFLRWYCHPRLLDRIEGDLLEVYADRAKRMGKRHADIYLWRDVILLFRKRIIRPLDGSRQLNLYGMYKSYWTMGWRQLAKNKFYSFLNIAGLANGLACTIAIALFVFDEYGFDRFHKHADHIYRVVQEQDQAGNVYHVASTPAPLADALKADFPEIANACILKRERTGSLQHENIMIESSSIVVASQSFFKMFDFPLLVGNREKVFTEPNEVIISQQTAINLFGNNWMNDVHLLEKTITYNKTEALKLVGVMANPPSNSHLQFEVLIPHHPAMDGNNGWNGNNYLTYIQLNPQTSTEGINTQLKSYLNKYRSPTSTFSTPVLYLQPLTDIYLYSDFDFYTDWTVTSNITYVRLFSIVGVVVLIIAVFNFMNLSTARATQRVKEVGVRKSIGAKRSQIMIQFLMESVLITILSVAVALGLVNLGLPFLNLLAQKTLILPLTNLNFIGTIFLFVVIISMLSGFYPALFLSGFQPIQVLKGFPSIRSGVQFRQVLVVIQFSLAVILLIGSAVIFQQLRYMQTKDLGFDQEQLIYLKTNNLTSQQTEQLRLDLQKQSGIIHAAATSNKLVDVISSTSSFEWEGKSPEERFLITQMNIDPWFLATTNIEVIQGRNFSADIPSDTNAYLINETAAREMKWTSTDALGKGFSLWGQEGKVIGVVKDFHYRPMSKAIEPLVFMYRPNHYYSGLLIKAQSTDWNELIGLLERSYKKYASSSILNFTFLSQDLENQYRLEQRISKVLYTFTVLALLVACLGLYGLSIFIAETRTKEIGIRKVMGARIVGIVMLMNWDLLRWVTIAILVALPVAYYLTHQWLQEFVYKIELHPFYFILAGISIMLIAFATISIQSIKTARLNPVKSLRSE